MSKNEELLVYKAQWEEAQEMNEKLEDQVYQLQADLEASKKSSGTSKQLIDKLKNDLSDTKNSKEKEGLRY